MRHLAERAAAARPVWVPIDGTSLQGELAVPEHAAGLVLFAHGSGSSRHSPRNQFVAAELHHAGLATLLIDLLTIEEERQEAVTRHLRFDIPMLATRLVAVTDWAAQHGPTSHGAIGLFGASTGAAAALVAAAERPAVIRAVVSRGGRPDLAGPALARVRAPTLLIVGGNDVAVIGLNEDALGRLRSAKRLEIVPGATHLFEEAGTLERVTELAREWFERWFAAAERPTETAAGR